MGVSARCGGRELHQEGVLVGRLKRALGGKALALPAMRPSSAQRTSKRMMSVEVAESNPEILVMLAVARRR